MLKLLYPTKDQYVSLQSPAQEAFIKDEERRATIDGNLTYCWYDLKIEGDERTTPLPVEFSWQETTGDTEPSDAYFYLMISENQDMSNSWVYITKDTLYKVYNLKVDTVYYWRVQKHGKVSDISSFSTMPTLPRCLKIDGISNVRDMGGYAVKGGKIRQGLAYRGGEFEPHMQLHPSGAIELHRLGIKTEIDMRNEAINTIQLTAAQAIGIKRILVPFNPYQSVFCAEECESLNAFFKLFTKKENYPVYFHCWGGADRTGTAAFILGSLLGMNYNDLIYEYEFTSLSVWGIRTRNYCNFIEFVDKFKRLDGENLQEKARIFLKLYSNLTDNEIDEIQNILIEKG